MKKSLLALMLVSQVVLSTNLIYAQETTDISSMTTSTEEIEPFDWGIYEEDLRSGGVKIDFVQLFTERKSLTAEIPEAKFTVNHYAYYQLINPDNPSQFYNALFVYATLENLTDRQLRIPPFFECQVDGIDQIMGSTDISFYSTDLNFYQKSRAQDEIIEPHTEFTGAFIIKVFPSEIDIVENEGIMYLHSPIVRELTAIDLTSLFPDQYFALPINETGFQKLYAEE